MGLDSVELIIEWENRTGVEFSDRDAASIRTPEDAFRILRAKTAGDRCDTCASRLAFAEIRRWLMKQGHERASITPRTSLSSFAERPRHLINQLHRDLKIDQPAIGCHPALTGLFGAAFLIAGIRFDALGIPAITLGSLSLVFALSAMFGRRRFGTVGEWARHLSIRHRGRYQSSFSDEEIRSVIRDTTIGILGLDDHEFGWEKRFVEDLGMD
jgi:acyl carrier protein